MCRYQCSVYPFFLGFVGGKLVFASTALQHKGVTRENLLGQLKESLADARRNRYLPEDFTFKNPRKYTLRDYIQEHSRRPKAHLRRL